MDDGRSIGRELGRALVDVIKVVADPKDARIAELEAEVAGLKAHAAALDKNWETVHEAAMGPIRAALDLPDGTVPDLVRAIKLILLDLEETRTEAAGLRRRDQENEGQLVWLAAWCQEAIGVDNNAVIGREGWPHRLVEVVAKAVDAEVAGLRERAEKAEKALRTLAGMCVYPIEFPSGRWVHRIIDDLEVLGAPVGRDDEGRVINYRSEEKAIAAVLRAAGLTPDMPAGADGGRVEP